MSESPERFGVNQNKIIPLNSGMTLPTDFLYYNNMWEIVSSSAIFNINNDKIEKFNITNIGLSEIIDGDKKVWINGKSISINDASHASPDHNFTAILPNQNTQAFEIFGVKKKYLLASVNGIPSVLSLPDREIKKQYITLDGYEVQHISKAVGSSFLVAMKDGNWYLYRDVGGFLFHEADLLTYANGLYAIDDYSAIVGNRNSISLFKDDKLTPLISGFTHVMRIKK